MFGKIKHLYGAHFGELKDISILSYHYQEYSDAHQGAQVHDVIFNQSQCRERIDQVLKKNGLEITHYYCSGSSQASFVTDDFSSVLAVLQSEGLSVAKNIMQQIEYFSSSSDEFTDDMSSEKDSPTPKRD